MTVCKKCNGTGEITVPVEEHLGTVLYGKELCDECNGTGEVQMTNEEWIKSCNTEQLAKWLQEHMDCSNCDCNKDLCYKGYDCCELAFLEWLKQPHTIKE